jgi:hypothetical protein
LIAFSDYYKFIKDLKMAKYNAGSPPVAGAGSKVSPSKPVYRNASGYQVEEKVNEGPHGGKSGKVAGGGGQNTYDASEHNKLVGQPEYQKDPYRAKGSDFSVSHVDARTGQSGAHGTSSGHNELVTQSMHQCGPRHAEDDGAMTPVPADRSRVVASGFPIEINKGEGSSDTGEIGIQQMIDLQTGYVIGGEGGVVDYVPQFNVSVGKPIGITKGAGHVGQKR